ncbi:TPA: polysaccharide deacetylase [Candidatus Dependentiae bacterium]|nr:MAG: Polysaccharide deacetylase [candidate division TM6 bacterium GW2011_GWE2_31_21]KKP53720.1 MAG: Polysaccharide deacetylase [candidate division TM6 bacterium GW2011_GWF2_33_332]HBS48528.1 polysaccharide deacetylase [Candidatus Dependentiae bacterium]HBZ73143.1 polysaccharide deacetylase [Candidatus Dependentiae bacterium]
MKIRLFVLIIMFYSTNLACLNKTVLEQLAIKKPTEWSETVKGVKKFLNTNKKVVALTLDACGSAGDSLDNRIVDFLISKKIPVTFFITTKWILKHPEHFKRLQQYPFFDFQNHGSLHRPCSINGNSVYGIKGTENIEEIIEEVEDSAVMLEKLIGHKPKFYRSGTAFYDDVAVEVVNELGYEVVGFDVLGDRGATFSKQEVIAAFSTAKVGSIIIAHANRPERDSGEGIPEAIENLINSGFSFVKLSDYELC